MIDPLKDGALDDEPRSGTAPGPRPSHPDHWKPVVDLAPSLFDFPLGGSHGGPARRLAARVVHLAPGALDMRELVQDPDGWIGLLILDGLLMICLDAGRAHTGWLIGADDLVRPWDMGEISLTRPTLWRALVPTRVALLDRDFSVRAGGLPVLARALVTRASRTTNWLLAKSLVMAPPVVEERLLLAFALFGERWGTVHHDGVVLKLPLTHALLATLCGVRRPSVTLALHDLERDGVLTRTAQGRWLLRRNCAEQPIDRPSCWSEYAAALGLDEIVSAG